MPGERILVVDDNATNLKLLQFVLSSRGYEVVSAGDAEQALEVLKGPRPDLMLLDVLLPGMSGLELAERLKASPETRDIPIIAVTAYAMQGDEDKALAAGCDGYVAKPIDVRVLMEKIAALLGHQAPAAAP